MNTFVPSFAQLLDWIEGRLSEQDAANIATQVANADQQTHATVDWLRNFSHVSTRVMLKALPTRYHQELLRRFKMRAEENQAPSLFRRLLAQLTFDSGSQFATAGVRALNGLGNQRQMVYSTEVVDVVLNTQPSKGSGQLDVLGQVMPTAENMEMAFVVQLLRNDTEFQITQADTIGEFFFEAVPPGSYGLVLSAEQLEIHTPIIELRL
jgi:hypothetical protein